MYLTNFTCFTEKKVWVLRRENYRASKLKCCHLMRTWHYKKLVETFLNANLIEFVMSVKKIIVKILQQCAVLINKYLPTNFSNIILFFKTLIKTTIKIVLCFFFYLFILIFSRLIFFSRLFYFFVFLLIFSYFLGLFVGKIYYFFF